MTAADGDDDDDEPDAAGDVDPFATAEAITLDEAHEVFRKWFGLEYDLDAANAVLASAAVNWLDGDPVWMLVVSGPGNAKTETVSVLRDVATITSTITSPGALLSATSRRERVKEATGGLLREIGEAGILVVKDFTSIISMNAKTRPETLAALREVYDGFWSRAVGTDGGRTLEWAGRLVVLGAVTSAWDQAREVIASMGDRFVLLRVDSATGRKAAGRQAIANTGQEIEMRSELAAAATGVLAGMKRTGVDLDAFSAEALLEAADLVTLARTAVQRDYRGDVIDADAPEAPTRFAKQLAQVARGGASRSE